MEVVAKSDYIRLSPRKLLLVAKPIVGLSTASALVALKNLNQKAARILLMVVRQGIGNAVNNYKLAKDSLKIKQIEINKGPILKRGQPVSRGQWHEILSRTSHVKLIIEGEPAVAKKTAAPKAKVNGTKS